MFALALFQSWLLPGFMRWSWRGAHIFPRYSLWLGPCICVSIFGISPSWCLRSEWSMPMLPSVAICEIPPNTKCTCVWSSHQQPFYNLLSLLGYFATRIVWWSDTGIPSQLIAASGTTIIVSTVVSALPFLFGPFEYSRSVQVYMVFVREPKCEYRECAWVLHERAYWAIEGWVRQLRSPVCRRHPSVLKRDRCWRHVGRSS